MKKAMTLKTGTPLKFENIVYWLVEVVDNKRLRVIEGTPTKKDINSIDLNSIFIPGRLLTVEESAKAKFI